MQPRIPQGLSGRAPMMMGMNRMPRPGLFGGAQQMNSGGGLLSRILGRGTAARGMGMNGLMGMQNAGRAAAGGGSFLQNLTNPSGLSGILNNTQQVLKTAQTVGPMIQQYGPIVRNLPAMWKIYRGFKNTPSDSEDEKSETNETSEESKSTSNDSSKKRKTVKNKKSSSKKGSSMEKQTASKPSTTVSREKGASVPKLYI